MNKSIIITTINEKTPAIRAFEQYDDWDLIIVGDKKSKEIRSDKRTHFLSLSDQLKLPLRYPQACPVNHYARKNVGYLFALSAGTQVIFETDDDNAPKSEWTLPGFTCNRSMKSESKFVNVYRYFTNEPVWPRGFPLDQIRTAKPCVELTEEAAKIGIWQGLADGDPDVDAIYRLVNGNSIIFDKPPSVFLPQGSYCPFNSQNTFWCSELFPLMYLPATVSFRFTDILRGYIAQRLCWQHDYRLGFTGATVVQDRNCHNLIDDFVQEWSCYIQVPQVVDILDSITLSESIKDNLVACYRTLCQAGIVSTNELDLVEAWIYDVSSIVAGGTG